MSSALWLAVDPSGFAATSLLVRVVWFDLVGLFNLSGCEGEGLVVFAENHG